MSLPSPNVTLPKLALSAAATCAEPECTPSPNLDKNVPLNCDEPDTTPLPLSILATVTDSPKSIVPPLPISIPEFANFPFAIEPANCELAIFVTCDEPVTTPVPPNKVSSVIEPPKVTDVPLIVIESCANLAIGISSLSISATIVCYCIVN